MSRGLASGFGPYETTPSEARLTCLQPQAIVIVNIDNSVVSGVWAPPHFSQRCQGAGATDLYFPIERGTSSNPWTIACVKVGYAVELPAISQFELASFDAGCFGGSDTNCDPQEMANAIAKRCLGSDYMARGFDISKFRKNDAQWNAQGEPLFGAALCFPSNP